MFKLYQKRCVFASPVARNLQTSAFKRFNSTQATAAPVQQQAAAPAEEIECNIGPAIQSKLGKNLHLRKNHPLNIIKTTIENYFLNKYKTANGSLFKTFDNMSPKVSTKSNFDDLLFPMDHVSRRPTDTYFYDSKHVLRTHTTAHQVELMNAGHSAFLISGDVYRRDDIDARHYPVFHQMDGVRIFSHEEYLKSEAAKKNIDFETFVVNELKSDLEGLGKALFGNDVPDRWIDAYFPFTHPSLELEINFQNNWLEVLGCGVIQRDILRSVGYDPAKHLGYAFGLGLERLAMVLFDIQDIRLFWTEGTVVGMVKQQVLLLTFCIGYAVQLFLKIDARFHDQFKSGEIVKFKSYSKYPSCYKDISMWVPAKWTDNDFYEFVREIAGDIVGDVKVIDDFVHPKTQKRSKCYRITYQSMDRNLTNEEIDKVQFKLRDVCVERMGVELR